MTIVILSFLRLASRIRQISTWHFVRKDKSKFATIPNSHHKWLEKTLDREHSGANQEGGRAGEEGTRQDEGQAIRTTLFRKIRISGTYGI